MGVPRQAMVRAAQAADEVHVSQPPRDAQDSQSLASSDEQSTPAARRGPKWWGIVIFLLLLGGMVLVNQWMTTGGPPIQWAKGDLDAALAQISAEKPRVFLYLYEPGNQAHQRNELQVFPQRWARYPLEHAVCVRIELHSDMASQHLRTRFAYDKSPLFLLLNRAGQPVGRAEGAVDERQFSTQIGKQIMQAIGKSDGSDQP